MMRFLKSMIAAALAIAAAVGVIHAQIRLPLSLPSVPLPPVAQSLDAAQSGTLDAAREWRHRQIARLLRENARLIETDPNGEPILRSEIIAAMMVDEALARALERGFVLARESLVGDIHLRVLKAPAGLATRNALQDLRAADARGVYDYNHIYLGVGVNAPDPSASAALPASPPPAWSRSWSATPPRRTCRCPPRCTGPRCPARWPGR